MGGAGVQLLRHKTREAVPPPPPPPPHGTKTGLPPVSRLPPMFVACHLARRSECQAPVPMPSGANSKRVAPSLLDPCSAFAAFSGLLFHRGGAYSTSPQTTSALCSPSTTFPTRRRNCVPPRPGRNDILSRLGRADDLVHPEAPAATCFRLPPSPPPPRTLATRPTPPHTKPKRTDK